MLDRKHLERVLKINGVSPTASNDEIRTVLLSAHYREVEVDAALVLLQSSDQGVPASDTDSMQKLLRTDGNLNAKEISKLLGIDIIIPGSTSMATKASDRELSLGHHVVIWSLAIIIAILGLGLSMYALEYGFFHPASVVSFYEKW
ncbi:hypothetical protein K2Q16_02655 [Patescibacteria group bacterium]|nr:hypothetical protein [Patescibacteria group bacterium]